jgi:hypothetical protein
MEDQRVKPLIVGEEFVARFVKHALLIHLLEHGRIIVGIRREDHRFTTKVDLHIGKKGDGARRNKRTKNM